MSKGLPPKSAIFVPMLVGGKVMGSISLQNVMEEQAFTESDVRLLNTLTNSMSVALENARLFNETTRLLAETEQRAAEMQTVNKISKALVSQLEFDVCKPDDLVVNFTYEAYNAFAEESTFSVVSPPAGLGIAFTPALADTTNTQVSLSLTGTNNLAVGSYPINITSTSASITKQITVTLNVYDSNFTEVLLTSPEDGVQDESKDLVFLWEENLSSTQYDIEIATDVAFASIVESATVNINSYPAANLDNNTQYY